MTINSMKKKKKKGARIFPFSNVFVFKRLNACTNTNITFYGSYKDLATFQALSWFTGPHMSLEEYDSGWSAIQVS